MKKFLPIVLIGAMVLSFAGCSTPASSAPEVSSESPSSEVQTESSSEVSEDTMTEDVEMDDNQFISVEDAKALIDSGEDVVVFGVLSDVKAMVPLTDENSPIDGTYRVWRGDYSGSGSTEAISVNVGGFRKGEDVMDDLLSKAGVTEDSKIIVYSTGSMHDSTRFGWQLELVGLEPMYLDGGLNAWKDAGYDTGKQVTLANEDVKTEFVSTQWNVDELGADIYDVITALENPDEWVIIDTRTQDEFDGKETGSSSGAYGVGAITGAVHIEWVDALNEDKTLKSPEELEAIYGDLIDGKKVITFCQSGVRSSHTMMVLREILGVEDVYNYDGSWIEWSYAASEAGTDVDPELKEKVKSYTEKWEDNGKAI